MTARILLIDDNPFLGQLMEEFLRRKGLDLTIATTGEEGLRLLERLYFDLVLLDLDLVAPSALEVIRRINDGRPAPPVLLLTTDPATTPQCLEALRLGAAGVLGELTDLESIYQRISSLLQLLSAPIPGARVACHGNRSSAAGNPGG